MPLLKSLLVFCCEGAILHAKALHSKSCFAILGNETSTDLPLLV